MGIHVCVSYIGAHVMLCAGILMLNIGIGIITVIQ